MIFGTPITWFVAELIALVLFIFCVAHASKQEHGTIKVLALIGFLIYSAIFENIGVYTKIYDYDMHRVMLIGKVPLEILMTEAVIFYASLCLVDKLRIPAWGKPFAVGFLASFQDMSLDPSAVWDRYLFNGILSGQWNWTPHYDGTFFGIPFFNFSGWMYLMVFYVAALELGMWLYNKKKKQAFGAWMPFLAIIPALLLLVSPVIRFLLFAEPFAEMYTRTAELILLVVNYAVGIFMLLRYMKLDHPFNLKQDGPIFIVPLVLHIFDLAIAFYLGLTTAIIPVVVVSVLHLGFLAFVYIKGRKTAALPAK
jgi:hypothetical protein